MAEGGRFGALGAEGVDGRNRCHDGESARDLVRNSLVLL
jgi:hypothetical protein